MICGSMFCLSWVTSLITVCPESELHRSSRDGWQRGVRWPGISSLQSHEGSVFVLYIAKREVQVRRQNRSPVSVLYVGWLKRGENSVVPNVCLPRDTRGTAQVRPTVLFYSAA